MTRIFGSYAYGPGPRMGCWWDTSEHAVDAPPARGDLTCDVAIVGAGFTGLSAALRLAEAGASVMVFEAERVGWGASGRNGGFCCLGGGMLSDAALDRRFGKSGRLAWRAAERAAVDHLQALVAAHGWAVDQHSHGETCLAHTPRAFDALARSVPEIRENYRVEPVLIEKHALAQAGLNGPFHGAMTVPVGFGLNPRKLVDGMAAAVRAAGGQIFEHAPVTYVAKGQVKTALADVTARQVIVATNGYGSETVPGALAGRYMPTQSTVLVTRPLTAPERIAQGWTSDQMAYDSRRLLHYFRLMPDGRFLFGMRGGLLSGPGAEARARAAVVRDFRAMFPAWAGVEVSHLWSGLVCLSRNRLPFVGPLPGTEGVLAGFAYHGNGVAMGTFAGRILGDLALGQTPEPYPDAMRQPPARFPLGRWRRAFMPPIYAAFRLADMRR